MSFSVLVWCPLLLPLLQPQTPRCPTISSYPRALALGGRHCKHRQTSQSPLKHQSSSVDHCQTQSDNRAPHAYVSAQPKDAHDVAEVVSAHKRGRSEVRANPKQKFTSSTAWPMWLTQWPMWLACCQGINPSNRSKACAKRICSPPRVAASCGSHVVIGLTRGIWSTRSGASKLHKAFPHGANEQTLSLLAPVLCAFWSCDPDAPAFQPVMEGS